MQETIDGHGAVVRLPARLAGAPWPIKDAADYLGVSIRTLTRADELGKVRLIRFGFGRKISIPDSEVRRLADEGLKLFCMQGRW
jgi:hypothetical protein